MNIWVLKSTVSAKKWTEVHLVANQTVILKCDQLLGCRIGDEAKLCVPVHFVGKKEENLIKFSFFQFIKMKKKLNLNSTCGSNSSFFSNHSNKLKELKRTNLTFSTSVLGPLSCHLDLELLSLDSAIFMVRQNQVSTPHEYTNRLFYQYIYIFFSIFHDVSFISLWAQNEKELLKKHRFHT